MSGLSSMSAVPGMSGMALAAGQYDAAGGGNADDPCASHDHAMVFHSCVCAEILFKGWNTSNELQLFGSALAIFTAAVLYEGFKFWRETLQLPGAALSDSRQDIAKHEAGAGRARMCSGAHSLQTALHAVQATLSYMLMLVFMTYNVWLCLALVLGLTLGYFLFGWRRSALNDPNEHCQ